MSDSCFTHFTSPINSYSLPLQFTFPFNYTPHPLCIIAANELQLHLQTQNEWIHDFGIEKYVNATNVGKMFGVLLVQNQNKEIGYLSAFSGKLAGSHNHSKFVPPIVNMLEENSFYRQGELEVIQLNQLLYELENSTENQETLKQIEQKKENIVRATQILKAEIKQAKITRSEIRLDQKKILSPTEYECLERELNNQSIDDHYKLKKHLLQSKNQLIEIDNEFLIYQKKIEDVKLLRKEKSSNLQQKLFDAYSFVNYKGEYKNLNQIFEIQPPAGAGDCAAPKLLQYAYTHNLKPLAMAEFWWGQSPNSEIRKHKHFYPSCRSKCEPILGHMLQGLDVEINPIIHQKSSNITPQVIYEDDSIIVINKPSEMLSVPGKTNTESVYSYFMSKIPNITGPLIVHRLDMSTSGIMVLTKTKEAHEHLQKQFLHRTVKKLYVAILDGIVSKDSGTIHLPLRVDLDNRPQQLVCYTHGKQAITSYKVIERTQTNTRIHFFPHTGRTHQLRVHAAHLHGLNCPIIGDDLYGKKANRLHLHAQTIWFTHPTSLKKVCYTIEPDF